MAGSDAARATALDWAIIAAGALALISSLLPWYVFTTSIPFFGSTQSTHANAWDLGISSWFSVLLLIAAASLVLASTMGGSSMPTTVRSLITLVLSTMAFIEIVLRSATFPDASGGLGRVGDLVHFDLGNINLSGVLSFSSEAGYGLYLAAAAAAAAAVASLITFFAASRDAGRIS